MRNQHPQIQGPKPILTVFNAVAIVVGVVIGIGIFRLPPLVASNAAGGLSYMSFWVAGGIISILGALCYAELASRKPDAGGEYYLLREGLGPLIGFLLSWGRMTVIQTGSIALAAFILGDYAVMFLDLGPYGSSIYAGATVVLLTGLNMLGTLHSKRLQNIVTGMVVLLLIALGGVSLVPGLSFSGEIQLSSGMSGVSGAGSAMIFVLLTYGGWNEAAYLSAELKQTRKNMVRVLVIGISLISLIYLVVNFAYLQVLGLEGLRNTEQIGVVLAERLLGSGGAYITGLIVVVAALSTVNATVITGARTNYAMGRDFSSLKYLGHWNQQHNTPRNALIVQGIIAFMLVVIGTFTEEAIQTLVDYTAPAYWLFMLLTTSTIFIFRHRQGKQKISYTVPFYPLIPLAFMAACLFMLYSSVQFTGWGSLLGIAILLTGLPVYWYNHNNHNNRAAK